MNPGATAPSDMSHADEDVADQARAGHGIPSQDPDPAAQMPLNLQEADREAGSALVGGGVIAGAAAGGSIGIVAGRPAGVVVPRLIRTEDLLRYPAGCAEAPSRQDSVVSISGGVSVAG